MRRALIAAAVTSGLVAARRRRHVVPAPALVPVLPTQRTSTARFLDDDADLSVDEQQAQDERILEALDRY